MPPKSLNIFSALRNAPDHQLGPDDSRPVGASAPNGSDLYESIGITSSFVNIHQKPVGQVVLKNAACPNGICRFCSGTLIYSDLFLTAAHCFKKSGNCNCSISYDQWCAPGCLPIENSSVSFNYQGENPISQEKIFSIKGIEERGDDPLDYLILRLDGVPGDTYGYAKISNVEIKQNDKICIIGHPKGSIKKVAVGNVKKLDEKKIYYDVDTWDSNSGSGIIDTTSGNIVGIHLYNPMASIDPNLNVGIKMTTLLAASPKLRSLLPS